MKQMMWTGALIAALASSLHAQTQYTYVPNRQGGAGNNITIFNSTGSPSGPTQLPAAPVGPNPMTCAAGATASECIGVPSRNRVYVSSGTGAGTITVIDSQLVQIVATIIVPNSDTLGGMAVSQDDNTLYVAGHSTITSGAAPQGRAGIFVLDLNTLAPPTFVVGLPSPNPALDCDIVPASLVGGSGSGPGRVYFTVPALNQIGVQYNIGTGPAFLAPPAGTSAPTRLERAPDGSFLLSGCASAIMLNRRLIRIVPGSPDTVDMLDFVIGTGMSPSADDVVFRKPGASAPFTVYFVTADGAGNQNVHQAQVSPTGLPTYQGSSAPIGFYGNILRHDPFTDRIFVADTSGTAATFAQLDASTSPPSGFTTANSSTGGPHCFAFMPAPPPPVVDFVNPPAGLSAAGFQLEIRGSGFLSGSSKAQIFNITAPITATSTTVLSPTSILASFPPQLTTLFNVIVLNNDGVQSSLNSFFQAIAPPPTPASTAFAVSLPPAGAGYSMLSFPQYATIGDLQAAVAAQLGPYNPILYRIFLWEVNRYVELNSASLDPNDSILGRGFFALSRNGQSLSLTTLDVTGNTSGGQRVVALNPGWNLISQPWTQGTHTILLSAVQATAAKNLTGTQAADAAPLLLFGQIFERVGNAYQTSLTMTAGRAYWMHNETAAPVYLIFPLGSVTKPAPPVSPAAPSFAAGSPTPPPPPGSSLGNGESSSGCGFLGLEWLLPALVARLALRRRRRPAA